LPKTLQLIDAYLRRQPWPAEVIVADDGSSDQTASIVEQLAAIYLNLRVLRLDHRGKGYAVRQGMLAATGQFVLFSDADLAVPITEWPKLETQLDAGYQVVIGSREGIGARREGEPFYRHAMGRTFNLIVQIVALRGIKDTQCGFKVFTREAAHNLFQRVKLYGDQAEIVKGAAVTAFDVEILYLARRYGYRISEVPVLWNYGEETKVDPLRDSWRNLRDVLRVRWNAILGRYAHVSHRLPTEKSERGAP
jgi:glycosyltransferase involved in cell wall biosynthesis